MFVYMKLVRMRTQVDHLTVVHKDNYDVYFRLKELSYVSLLVPLCCCIVMQVNYYFLETAGNGGGVVSLKARKPFGPVKRLICI